MRGGVSPTDSEGNFPKNKKIFPTDRLHTRVDSAPLHNTRVTSLNNIPANSSFINAMKFKTNNAPRGHVNKLSKTIPFFW